MDRIRKQNINQTMEDEASQNNQDIGRLVETIQQMPMQIENIEHNVSSTKNTVELMAAKLDDLIGKFERRDFLDNPSQWPHGTFGKNDNSDFGPFL